MASRRSENQRASNYRKIIKDGGQLEPDKAEWLKNYEATKRKPGRPAKPEEPERDLEANDLPRSIDDETPPDAPPPPPPVDDLPPPPRVMVSVPTGGGRSGDWREKYRQNEKGGTGREQTCTLVASYWLGALVAMADAIKASGADPIVEPKDLGPAIILTVDEVLPDHVEISPRVMAVGGSSALLVQRFIRRKEIKEAQAKADERAKHQEWKDHRKDPPPPTDIASHPEFKPAEATQAQAPDTGRADWRAAAAPGESPVTAPSYDPDELI